VALSQKKLAQKNPSAAQKGDVESPLPQKNRAYTLTRKEKEDNCGGDETSRPASEDSRSNSLEHFEQYCSNLGQKK